MYDAQEFIGLKLTSVLVKKDRLQYLRPKEGKMECEIV